MRSLILGMLVLVPSLVAGDADDLKAAFHKAVEALNARNLEGFTSTIHPQSLSFYSCGPTSGQEGKEACEKDWKKFFQYTAHAKFDAGNAQVRVIGNTGVVWGTYEAAVRNKDGQAKVHKGRYSLIYTKVDGKWMIVWQENSPEASPAS
jgi:uncharacterized protein (TIGR02246 family)